jgi:6-phosphofructokinase 1
VAEGAFDKSEAKMKRKERAKYREEQGLKTATERIAKEIEEATGIESRVCVPGHMLRGGTPSAYDRILATDFGVRAAKLVENEVYGVTVSMNDNRVTENKLSDIAGKTKFVTEDEEAYKAAKRLGVSFGV